MSRDDGAWISGVGVASPYGSTIETLWLNALRASPRISKVRSFDASSYRASLAGEIDDFNVADVPGMLRQRTDRSTQLSLITAQRALDGAAVRYLDTDPLRRSVVTANAAGGYAFGEKELRNLYQKGPAYVSTAQSYAWFYAVNTGQVSIRYGFKGRCSTVVADSAGGLDAIWEGARLLERGQDFVLAGAVESFMSPLAWVSMESTGRLSESADPEAAYLPFDSRAKGYVPAEGGAYFALTKSPPNTAEKESIRILGHGKTMTINESGVDGIKRAMLQALDRAELRPSDIDVVFADGAAVEHDDHDEATAITDIFGARGVPVTVPKSGFGRAGAGMGPLDTALAALTLKSRIIPATPSVVPSTNLQLDCVTTRRRVPGLQTALIVARGLPIFNSALVIGTR